MRFKWGALLAVAALGALSAAVAHCCFPYTTGEALDSGSGVQASYVAVLNLKRVVRFVQSTPYSELTQGYPAPGGTIHQLLAFDANWHQAQLSQALHGLTGVKLGSRLPPAYADVDRDSLLMLDSILDYLEHPWPAMGGGYCCGFTPAGKAQLMRNMLEVLRRRGESKYLNRMVLAELMAGVDHPAGPEDVPTPEQIIRKGAQRF